ncbi:hypothetical protein KDL44_00040 [bacterium]|nr:hypothetical protein [bacterium]
MDDKKKQLNQVIILTVLLVGLGFGIMTMMKSISGSRPKPSKDTAQSEAPTGASTRVTPMGTVVTGGTVDDSKFKEQGFVGALNTNVFRVYDIDTKRNPFKPESGWFGEQLENLPATKLPENYLNEMTDEVPDLNQLFNTEQEFVAYSMEKRMAPEIYNFEGTSEDGRINTRITASAKSDPSIRVEYSEALGTEIEEIAQPKSAEDGQGQGLPFVGSTSQQGASPRDIRAPRNGEEDRAGMITCSGVSIKGESRSALLQMADGTHLVREGDVLMPGNFKVVKISELGVEIRDIRTAEQVLIPLSNPV